MSTHTHRILIGAAGWLHPAWLNEFYPDDLPADWQLGFYSNEFPVVLIPSGDWPTVRTEIQEWLEDSHDELQFICEVDPDLLLLPEAEALSAISAFIEELSVLGSHCAAVLLPVAASCQHIIDILTALNSRVPLCLALAGDIPADRLKSIQKVCADKKIGLCWPGTGDASGLSYGPLAISRINTQAASLHQLREIVETILNTTTLEQISVLIFDGQPPDVDAMRNANVILDLI